MLAETQWGVGGAYWGGTFGRDPARRGRWGVLGQVPLAEIQWGGVGGAYWGGTFGWDPLRGKWGVLGRYLWPRPSEEG